MGSATVTLPIRSLNPNNSLKNLKMNGRSNMTYNLVMTGSGDILNGGLE